MYEIFYIFSLIHKQFLPFFEFVLHDVYNSSISVKIKQSVFVIKVNESNHTNLFSNATSSVV